MCFHVQICKAVCFAGVARPVALEVTGNSTQPSTLAVPGKALLLPNSVVNMLNYGAPHSLFSEFGQSYGSDVDAPGESSAGR